MSIRLTLKDDESVVNKRSGLQIYKGLTEVQAEVIKFMHFFESCGLTPKLDACIDIDNLLIQIMRRIEDDYSLDEEDVRCL